MIEGFHTILQILTCGTKPKSIGKVRTYAIDIYQQCIQLYDWYPMPPSVHKILMHGADIMNIFRLPLGWYSEEALECNNKYFRKARSDHSRMCNRIRTNEDIFKHLLASSDPYLARLRIVPIQNHPEKTTAAKLLLRWIDN